MEQRLTTDDPQGTTHIPENRYYRRCQENSQKAKQEAERNFDSELYSTIEKKKKYQQTQQSRHLRAKTFRMVS